MSKYLLQAMHAYRNGDLQSAFDIGSIIDLMPTDVRDARLFDNFAHGREYTALAMLVGRDTRLVAMIGERRVEKLLSAVLFNKTHAKRSQHPSFYQSLENGLRDMLPNMRRVA